MFDAQKRMKRPVLTSVANAAVERDLYRVDTEKIDPNIMEKEYFQKVDSLIGPIIKSITENNRLPSGEYFENLMAFMAIQLMRTPAQQNRLAQPVNQVGELMMRSLLRTPERWNANMDALNANREQPAISLSYEEAKKLIERAGAKIEVNKSYLLGLSLSMVPTLVRLLSARNWLLVTSEPLGAHFICTDYPVVLQWTKSDMVSHTYGPGFALQDTFVVFPINRKSVLFGTFEQVGKQLSADELYVANTNSILLHFARRFVYSAREDFLCRRGSGRIARVSELTRDVSSGK